MSNLVEICVGAPPNYAHLRSPVGLGAGVLYARALGAVSRNTGAQARLYWSGYPAIGAGDVRPWRGF